MRILILSEGYPNQNNEFIFVKNFVEQLIQNGYKVTVISPVSLTSSLINKNKLPIKMTISESLVVKRPRYISFSNFKLLWFSISNILMNISIVLSSCGENFDIVYSHFWSQIPSAYFIAKTKPVYVTVGESNIIINKMYPKCILKIFLKKVTGIISLSTKNLAISKELDLIGSSRTTVIPNGYNPNVFYKNLINKSNYGFSVNDFILGFIGNSNPTKGLSNLIAAFNQLEVNNLKLIIIGNIKNRVPHNGIFYTGIISQGEIAEYLSIVDVYCHTSTAEGSSNAIIEALACGKPVIASNKEFNDDLLRDDFSIRIDVEAIDEIKSAIMTLYSDQNMINKMAYHALDFIKDFTIEKRIRKVIDFINYNE